MTPARSPFKQMRINKYIAQATGMSRRAADQLLGQGRVSINGQMAELGHQVTDGDQVSINGRVINAPKATQTILMNKPVGYVCSRDGQGSQTIYDLLPTELYHLKPVGRLDKDSSGLLLLTNDGDLANHLTHPSFEKEKVYHIRLKRPLLPADKQRIDEGVTLEDGVSRLQLKSLDQTGQMWQVTMHQGRNRQIRRTFEALQNQVVTLERISFGTYQLDGLPIGQWRSVNAQHQPLPPK